MKTVLLGAAGTGTSFAIASRLRARWGSAIRLIAIDVNEPHLVSAALLADAYYRVPYADDPQFAAVLREIITAHKVDVYIPILNAEIILGATLQREDGFKGVDIWTSELYAKCTDKYFADSWLRSIAVRTPQLYEPGNPVGDALTWVCKPRDSVGGRNVRVLDKIGLDALSGDELKESIIQEVCSQPEVTVDSFYDADRGIGYSYCRERLEIKSGVCTKARLFFDAELDEFAKTIGQALGQRGTLCFQVMKAAEGWAVTDLNLRSGAGTAMTCSAGYDVLSAGFACRTGAPYADFIKPLVPGEEFYITRQYAEFVTRHSL
jgi:hypothetical protein